MPVTSTVIPDPKDWADDSLLIPHETIRNALNTLVDLLTPDYFESNDDWKIEAILKWYSDFVYPFVHHHHEAEEKVYFPFIEERAKLPEKLSKDHSQLDVLLDEVKAARDVEVLREKAKALRHFMFEHLSEEETHVPKILREKFTEEEETACIGRIMQSFGPEGMALGLPWILDVMEGWRAPDKVDEFFKALPPPVQEVYTTTWKVNYENNNVGLIKSIKANKK